MFLSSAGWKKIPVFIICSVTYLIARGQPEPAFIIENTDKCVPSVVNFINNTDAPPGYYFLWDFGNNQLVYNQEEHVTETYTSAGHHEVVLYLTNGIDTTRTKKSFVLYTPPAANFEVSDNMGCVPLKVGFSDISTPGDGKIDSRSWDIRTGQLFSDSAFSFTYRSPGNYGVLFRITDEHGCSDYIEKVDYIHVNPSPVPEFSSHTTFACMPPLQVNFLDKSTGNDLTYYWDLGNSDTTNEQFPTTIYSKPGIYDVSLEITDGGGCTASIVKENYIQVGQSNPEWMIFHDNERVTGNNDTICPGTIRFEVAGNTGSNNSWKLDDNTPVISGHFEMAFTDSGHHQLVVIHNYSSVCPDTMVKSFFIDFIRADFTLEDTVSCQYPLVVSPGNQSLNSTSVKWLLPSGKESDMFNPIDTTFLPEDFDPYAHLPYKKKYEIVLQAYNENGCMDKSTKSVRTALPVARFVPDVTSGCIPLKVTYADSSKSEADIVSRRWFVNNTLIAEDIDTFDYTFETEGVHNSYLVTTNEMGCIDTSYNIAVSTGRRAALQLNAMPASLCYGDSVTLNISTEIKDSVDYYHFNIPGAAKSGPLEDLPVDLGIFHEEPGAYSLHANVDYNGCITDTILENRFYLKGPAGHFTDSFSCHHPYQYDFMSHVKSATLLQWQVIDSILPVTSDTISHVFGYSGNYNVTLTAWNDTSGCVLTTNKIIPVRNVMAGTRAPSVACAGIPVLFNSGDSRDYITECFREGFLWDFDDGSIPRRTYDTIKTHTFERRGTFNVELTVSADNGCTSKIIKPIQVHLPEATYTVNKDTFCAPSFTASFSADSSNDPVKSYTWNLGDGTILEGAERHVDHTYHVDRERSLLTSLMVEDHYGCKAIHHLPVYVYKPDAEFYAPYNRGCNGDEISFMVLETEVDSFTWDFGDGDQSTTSFSHTYNTDGLYTVTREVYKNGCMASTTKTSYISIESADASFTITNDSNYCYPVTVKFEHTGNNEHVNSGSWNFAPGHSSVQYSPSAQYTYSAPGQYLPSLSITTLNGCMDQAQQEINVNGPGGVFTITDDVACKGEPITFTLLEKKDVENFQWIFGDGNTGNDSVQHHVYYQGGYFVPSLKLIDKKGCEAIITNDTIFISHLEVSLETDKDALCVNEILTLNNNITGISKYVLWMNDKILAENSPVVNTAMPEPGTYRFQLIAQDIHQCADTAIKEVEVFPNPTIQASKDTTVCNGETIVLFALSEDDNVISWHPETGLDDPSSNFPKASPNKPITYIATATGKNGCKSSEDVNISIILPPSINTTPEADTTISKGQKITIGVETDTDAVILWSPDQEISCTDCRNPVVRPLESTMYEVTSENSCFKVSDNIMVYVIVDFHLEMPDAFTPNGDGINDMVHVKGKNINKLVEFKVYNRWGNIVFESDEIEEGWDGTLRGEKLPSGTYTYFVRALTNHNFEVFREGTIILLD